MPGSSQVANSAGGYAWAVDDWMQLDRFLVLGSEGGTYYIQPQKLTRENAKAVRRCLQTDGRRVVARVVEVSENGRAPRNDPALFVLAMAAGLGDEATRQAAIAALPRVARTSSTLWSLWKGSAVGAGHCAGVWLTGTPASTRNGWLTRR
ncbi:MAG: hypothetical protein BroJett015_21070 [Chloroflexota bacterium]|nr:MAG: hypothetical protein BroJett015_21070 [Chloroflexota bacterium]